MKDRAAQPPRDEDPARAGLQRRIASDPNDTAARLQLGLLEEERGHWMEAVDSLQAARRLGASDGDTSGPMGRCLERLRRYDESLAERERAVRIDPDRLDAVLALADAHADGGAFGKAEAVLETFLKRRPGLAAAPSTTDLDIVGRLAAAFDGYGASRIAGLLARQLIRLAPTEPDGYALSGKQLLASGNPLEAETLLRRAVELAPQAAPIHYLHGVALSRLPGKMDSAVREWREAVTLDSGLTTAQYLLGRAYAARKEPDVAADAFLAASQSRHAGPELLRLAAAACVRARRTPEAIHLRAQAAELMGDQRAALESFQKLSRESEARWRELGEQGAARACLALHRYPEYLALIQRSTEAQSGENWLRRADAYEEMREDMHRQECLRQALAKDPGLAGRVHAELGELATRAGRFDEAEQELTRAIAAEPGNAAYHRAQASLYLRRRSVGDRSRRAVREAEDAARLDANAAAGYHLLGVARSAVGELPGAVEAFQRAIDLDPRHSATWLDLGQVWLRLGDRERGQEMLRVYRMRQAIEARIQDLNARLQSDPNDGSARIAMGDLHFRGRDYERALAEYTRAGALAPADAGIRRKRDLTYRVLRRAEGEMDETGITQLPRAP